MTHTFAYYGENNFPDKKHLLERYNAIIQSSLNKYAPEYFPVLQEMNESEVEFLLATIYYWESRLESYAEKTKFLETKIIECLAFWFGIVQAGGSFPTKPLNVASISSKRNNDLKTLKRNQITAVVPIGNLSPRITSILQKTLTTLNRHKSIGATICVFDGCHPKNNNLYSNKKTENIFLDKKWGPAHARNVGLQGCGPKNMNDILFLDSDVTLSLEMLNKLLNARKDYPAGILCPKIIGTGSLWWDEYHDICGTLNGRNFTTAESEGLLFGTTSCMMVSQGVLESGIHFSEDFHFAGGEDIDFCINTLSAGYSVQGLDNVEVEHWYGYDSTNWKCSKNWRVFKDRFQRYGKGEALLVKLHPKYYELLNQTKERASRPAIFSSLDIGYQQSLHITIDPNVVQSTAQRGVVNGA
jgi:hypothetical protein